MGLGMGMAMGIRDMAWMCDLISPIVKLYTLLTVIHTVAGQAKHGRAQGAANVTGSNPTHGFPSSFNYSKLQRALYIVFYSFSFLFFFDYGEIFGNSHRVPPWGWSFKHCGTLPSFGVKCLLLFSQWKSAWLDWLWLGLALFAEPCVGKTKFQKKKKENKRKKPKKKVPLPQKFVQFFGFFF